MLQVACDDVREAHRSKFRGIIADVTSAVAMAAAKRQAVLASPGDACSSSAIFVPDACGCKLLLIYVHVTDFMQ